MGMIFEPQRTISWKTYKVTEAQCLYSSNCAALERKQGRSKRKKRGRERRRERETGELGKRERVGRYRYVTCMDANLYFAHRQLHTPGSAASM